VTTRGEWERRWLTVTVRVLATGGTYCYRHGLVEEHCTECSVLGFPDLGPYLLRARAALLR
jgi:hypothetical protein